MLLVYNIGLARRVVYTVRSEHSLASAVPSTHVSIVYRNASVGQTDRQTM